MKTISLNIYDQSKEMFYTKKITIHIYTIDEIHYTQSNIQYHTHQTITTLEYLPQQEKSFSFNFNVLI